MGIRRGQAGLAVPIIGASGVDATTSKRPIVTATASGSTHTKGAWTEVVSALAANVTFIRMHLTTTLGVNTTDTSTLLDIGVGASGQETVIVPDLPVGYTRVGERIDVLVYVPSGSRVAVRCQSAIASKQVAAEYTFGSSSGRRPASALTSMGVTSASSQGTALPVPVANTKTAWVQLAAATAADFAALIVSPQAASDTTLATGNALIDVGVGPLGQEVVALGDLAVETSNQEFYAMASGRTWRLASPIPAGSRLAARWQTDQTASSMDLVVHGVPLG